MSEETRDIHLRPLSLDDVDFMVMLTQNHDVARFIPGMITDKEGLTSWINPCRMQSGADRNEAHRKK